MAGRCLSLEAQRAVLRCLAAQVVSARGLARNPESLVEDPCTLYFYVLQTSVDWRRIAAEIHEDRNRIYHWYRETHSRNIFKIKMTREDRNVMQALIIRGIHDQSIMAPGFYERIYARFGGKYPHQELRMTYNNTLRTRGIQRIFKECGLRLPSRRQRSAKQPWLTEKGERPSPQILPWTPPSPATPGVPVSAASVVALPQAESVPASGFLTYGGHPGFTTALTPLPQPVSIPPLIYLPLFVPTVAPDQRWTSVQGMANQQQDSRMPPLAQSDNHRID